VTVDATSASALPEERAEAFAESLLSTFTAGMTTLMIDLASRTGLLDALGGGPATSAELAARAGLVERYVRECLSALAAAGVVTYDAQTAAFALPSDRAVCLTGSGSGNIAPLARATTLLARHVTAVAHAFRHGGGVPYEQFRPEFTAVMDGMSRGLLDGQLLTGIVPLVDGLAGRLARGARVADVGMRHRPCREPARPRVPPVHRHRRRHRDRRDRRRPRRGRGVGIAQRVVRGARRNHPARQTRRSTSSSRSTRSTTRSTRAVC
jgi:hypothetical protein